MVGKTTVASPRPWLCLRSGVTPFAAIPGPTPPRTPSPPPPQSAASCKPTPLRPQDRSHPVRPAPSPPPPRVASPRPPQPPRGSGALTLVCRRRPVRPPPIRRRSRGHRRPPSAPLWPTPEPPSLSTVHRCPESRAHQLLRSCNEGGKIYLVCP
jgi:hypothetical protein